MRETQPLPEEYSRVTNPERFRPLHAFARGLFDALEAEYEVVRSAGFDPLPEMTPFAHEAPPVTLTPVLATAAPLAIAFTGFPGVILRFGRWKADSFPSCGCDACAETADWEGERLERTVRDVVAGRFRERLTIPLLRSARLHWSFGQGEGWSTLSPEHARALRRRGAGEVRWDAWPKRGRA